MDSEQFQKAARSDRVVAVQQLRKVHFSGFPMQPCIIRRAALRYDFFFGKTVAIVSG
jgi:hypothetical protein